MCINAHNPYNAYNTMCYVLYDVILYKKINNTIYYIVLSNTYKY